MKQKKSKSITILITPGDPGGIGPEITFKALKSLYKKYSKQVRFVVIGDEFKNRTSKKFASIFPAPLESHLQLAGYQSGWSIEVACKLLLSGEANAMVTGPISKENLQKGGYYFSGHTELLASLCKTPKVTMMLANNQMRVTLVTTHTALKKVASQITQDSIEATLLQTQEGIKKLYGIKKPKVAVLGLNPHASDGGLFGNEEREMIAPAIKNMGASGPFPADTFFALEMSKKPKDRFDAVVGMYHDQALAPVKLIDFFKTVNITLGLPIIRTSVDHGTAFDIAGKNKADPSSMIAAIEAAILFSKNEKRTYS